MYARYIDLLGKVHQQVRTVLPFGLSIKLILGGVLGVLGGSGALGYVSDYATYWYAMNIGIRSPLEGVAYLKAAVTLGSIFLLITSGLAFALSILALRMLYHGLIFTSRFSRSSDEKVTKSLEILIGDSTGISKKFLTYCVRIVGGGDISQQPIPYRVFFLLLSVTAGYFTGKFSFEAGSPPISQELTIAISMLYFGIAGLVTAFPRSVWPLAFILTSAYFLFCLVSLFNADRYAWFLRTVGYGGGYPVTIQTKNDQLKTRLLGAKTSLVLRTNDTFILFEETRNSFIEVPKDDVVFITYDKGEIRYYDSTHMPRQAR